MGAGARSAVLISGFYGFGNIGDEAVLAGLLQSLRARLGDVPFIVLSADPPATAAAHGVEAVPRTRPAAVVAAMRRSRLFLSGGGSLLQDVTSARSAFYYLGLLRLAQAVVPRTMVYASGIGPLRRRAVRALARAVLNRTDAVTVRDTDSADVVRALGVHGDTLITADPAVVLEPAGSAGFADAFSLPGGPPAIGAVVRPWRDNAFLAPLGAALRDVAARRGARIMVLPFHPAMDMAVSQRLASICGGSVVAYPLSPGTALALVARMRVLVGLRFHALLFAAAGGVPPVGLAYDPKVTALLHDLGAEALLPLEAGRDALVGTLDRAWEERDARRAGLLARTAALRQRVQTAVDTAARLYASSAGLEGEDFGPET